MEYPKIDETKLPIVKEIITKIEYLCVDKDYDEESQEVKELIYKLQEVTGKQHFNIKSFAYYSSYTSLDEIAISTLLPIPQKTGLSNEQIKELVIKISNVEFDDAIMEYFLDVLKVETGLRNITDYIYYPDQLGMEMNASIDCIIERIIKDKK